MALRLVALQSKNGGGSDSEKEDSEISEINKVLEKHDPGFMKYGVQSVRYSAAHLATSLAVFPGSHTRHKERGFPR